MSYFSRTKIATLGLASLTGIGYYQYHHDHSFKSICNLVYAGTQMTLIYKYGQQSLSNKHIEAC